MKEYHIRWKQVNIELLLQTIYLGLMALFLAYQYFWNTMFSVQWPPFYWEYLKAALVLVIILRAGLEKKYDKREVLIIAVLGAAFLAGWKRSGYEEILLCVLLIWGARGIRLKKVLGVFFAVIFTLLAVTVIASLTGQITNLTFEQENRRPRMAFGTIYPTDFSAFLFYLSIVYCYLRGQKLRYLETFVIFLLGGAVYYFCDARLNTICLWCVAAAYSYLIFRSRQAQHKKIEYRMKKGLSWFLAAFPTLCAVGMIGLTMLYSPHNKLISMLNDLLNNRLYYGKKGIDLYGIPVLGNYIVLRGNGGTTEKVTSYFFLDSSYLYILLQFGLVVLVAVLTCWCLISFQGIREKDWFLLAAVALIALQCTVEHHMMMIAFNPFFMALLADRSTEKRKQEVADEKSLANAKEIS